MLYLSEGFLFDENAIAHFEFNRTVSLLSMASMVKDAGPGSGMRVPTTSGCQSHLIMLLTGDRFG